MVSKNSYFAAINPALMALLRAFHASTRALTIIPIGTGTTVITTR